MIKVFLAEDEFVIREAVKRTIDWEKEGYELVGEAGDGETALEKLRECRADILITDIRMPFMDGLELARLVRKELPDTLVIILSGYDDFSYAKEAIRLGVTEYVLKPVTGALLLETLSKVSKRLDSVRVKQQQKEMYEKVYQPRHEEQLRQERAAIYRGMTEGSLDFASAMMRSQELGIRISADYYCVLLFNAVVRGSAQKSGSGADGSTEDTQTELLRKQLLQSLTERKYIGGYKMPDGVLCVIVMANEQEQLKERIDEAVRIAWEVTAGDKDTVLSIAAGQSAEGIEEVPRSLQEALHELENR